MTYLIRTTITLPEPLLEQAKYYAVINKTNLSQLIRESLTTKIRAKINNKPKSLLTLAGSLNLGGKEPPTRNELYESDLKQKIGA
ncbi:MAG: DUF6364 family protein [Patescibacteria group bacterium]|nr:DUF6364 family protein [Patescibacteria group bacterium]